MLIQNLLWITVYTAILNQQGTHAQESDLLHTAANLPLLNRGSECK